MRAIRRYPDAFRPILWLPFLLVGVLIGALALGEWPRQVDPVRAAPLAAAPTVSAVAPSQAYNDRTTSITITGSDFAATPKVTLGRILLPNVTLVSATTLTATVPADLPGGTYTVTVTNPDTTTASRANAFTAVPSGDGSITSWQFATSLPAARTSPAAVVAGEHVYVAGGALSNGTITSTVSQAALDPFAQLGSWSETSPLVTARRGAALVAASGSLYAIGGRNGAALTSVERAVINSDGGLGAWGAAAGLGTARSDLGAVAAGGYLYDGDEHRDTQSDGVGVGNRD